MKTVETLKLPWIVVEYISYAWLGTAGLHLLIGGHIRSWVWVVALAGAIGTAAVQTLRWRIIRDEGLRRRYMRTVEYSSLVAWLSVIGLVGIFGLLYLLTT